MQATKFATEVQRDGNLLQLEKSWKYNKKVVGNSEYRVLVEEGKEEGSARRQV